jgi:hypothetical protein
MSRFTFIALKWEKNPDSILLAFFDFQKTSPVVFPTHFVPPLGLGPV